MRRPAAAVAVLLFFLPLYAYIILEKISLSRDILQVLRYAL